MKASGWTVTNKMWEENDKKNCISTRKLDDTDDF